MKERFINFTSTCKLTSMPLSIFLKNLFDLKIRVVSCVITKQTPKYDWKNKIESIEPSKACIICEIKSEMDDHNVDVLVKDMQ